MWHTEESDHLVKSGEAQQNPSGLLGGEGAVRGAAASAGPVRRLLAKAARGAAAAALAAGLLALGAIAWQGSGPSAPTANDAVAESIELASAGGSHAAWVATYFGTCYKDCGPARFRTVVCRDVFSGSKLADTKCSGSKPASAASCNCGLEVCDSKPAGGCKADSKLPSVGEIVYNDSYVKVGCFDFEAPPDDSKKMQGYESMDLYCMKWDSDKPCSGGLPFYVKKGLSEKECYDFCMRKGMDIFGVDPKRLCRCGASPVNKGVWHEEEPRPGLALDPKLLPPAGTGCPLKVFRYTGAYVSDGTPSEFWDIKEQDQEYVDSIVAGKRLGPEVEEDGLPEEEMAWGKGRHPMEMKVHSRARLDGPSGRRV